MSDLSNLKPYTVKRAAWAFPEVMLNGITVMKTGSWAQDPDKVAALLNDAYQAGLKAAPREQEKRTKEACLVAITNLRHMTRGQNSRDPGIAGVNLALDAAIQAVKDAQS